MPVLGLGFRNHLEGLYRDQFMEGRSKDFLRDQRGILEGLIRAYRTGLVRIMESGTSHWTRDSRPVYAVFTVEA